MLSKLRIRALHLGGQVALQDEQGNFLDEAQLKAAILRTAEQFASKIREEANTGFVADAVRLILAHDPSAHPRMPNVEINLEIRYVA